MMRRFRQLPIRHKLVVMIMGTTMVVLLLASIGYVVSDYFRTRAELARELKAQARLVLQNSQAALDFRDRDAAEETLRTLSANVHLRSACLYDGRGELFAQFHAAGRLPSCAPDAPAEGFRFAGNRLQLSEPGAADGKPFGSVTLYSGVEVLTSRVRVQAMVVAVLLVVALAVAWFLSSQVQAVVSQPVVDLAATAAAVSARGDYTLRARRTTDDELGVLVDAFNRMLERIELRESDLSKANDELRREIAERRRAEQERAQLLVREREANRVKDEFLATLSHELRTPLNAILGWTKLLRANAVPTASFDRALEKVERNAQVQLRLVEDLLEVSRITTGKLRLEVRSIDLVALANTALDSIRPAAEARGVAIERRFEQPSLETAGDPDRLQQVIWNLLSNAVKFTPYGGTVAMTLSRAEDVDEIRVSDTGVGIDPEFLPNVFDTFRQADASSTRTHGGLGLGLSIVKQLVTLHGGEVIASSTGAGQGATFTVRLPVPRAEPERQRVDVDPIDLSKLSEGKLFGTTVLVVDDDEDTRELLVSVLTTAGAQVREAASAAEALTAAVDDPPDVFISDIAMPGQDGHMLLETMTAALGARTPQVRVALSAFAGQSDRNRSLAAGFQQHLAKPFDPLELVQVLEDLLSGAVPRSSRTSRPASA